MPARRLPVRPELGTLQREVDELHQAIQAAEPEALADLKAFHPNPPAPDLITRSDAELVLARRYQAPDWPRLVQCCQLIDAIWRDDLDSIRHLIAQHPHLLHEDALVRPSNWGPPLSYAANLGRDRIIEGLHALGANDLETALHRAALQGQVGTTRMLHRMLGSPVPADGALDGPAYTQSDTGTELLLEFGARVCDEQGRRLAPVDVVLESDSRKPGAKHRILDLYLRHGLDLPNTATMALHLGRIDLLEAHLSGDPQLLRRTFTHEEIYPPDLGCHDQIQATQGTPLAGTTLLHLCVDYDEWEIALWLLDHGMDPDAPATVDPDGFGGHTALFGTVVSQPNFWATSSGEPGSARFAKLLLDRGADPNRRASLRKQLHPGYGDHRIGVYRDVTPLGWGRQFHGPAFVSAPTMALIADRGGKE